MAAPRLDKETLRRAIDAVKKHGSQRAAADALGVSRSTFGGWYERAKAAQIAGELRDEPPAFTIPDLPSEDIPTDRLIELRKEVFARKHVAKTARKLIPVRIKIDGPIGITHFGDPHVDDDGCDIARLERDMNTVNKTEGMFAANLGDLQNNWIGRLARLYADQSTSSRQAWQLVEWMVKAVPWVYLIGGNHDAWSGSGDPVKWIVANQPGMYEYNGVRVNLEFPNGKAVRVNARHDFTGTSMWNPAHGPMKAVQGGWRDHILTCGHLHTSFCAGPLKDPASGLLSWAIRCAGYKIWDRYAEEKGLPDQNAFAAAVTIVDPAYDDSDTRLVTVIPSVDEGAEFLRFKRKRWAQGRR